VVWLFLATKLQIEGEAIKRTNFAKDECPVARSIDAVGDLWSLLIVRDAFLGRRRFGEIQKSLGVAKNILTVRLRKLLDERVLELVPASDGSAFQEYSLSARGRELLPVIAALGQWGGASSAFQMVDRKYGKPVRLELRSNEGRKLTSDEVHLVAATHQRKK
jgi:DNA-binding HxlR family transcriptional regulator